MLDKYSDLLYLHAIFHLDEKDFSLYFLFGIPKFYDCTN